MPDARHARGARHRRPPSGVGCDQIIIMEPPRTNAGHAFMRIRNADGSEVEACGNGARCVADAADGAETGRDRVVHRDTRRADRRPSAPAISHRRRYGRAAARLARDSAGAGVRHAACAAEPRAADRSGLHQHGQSARDLLRRPIVAAIDIATLGPTLEHDPMFPARANIGVAQIVAPDTHPRARLGARRRANARLRQRRLRGRWSRQRGAA